MNKILLVRSLNESPATGHSVAEDGTELFSCVTKTYSQFLVEAGYRGAAKAHETYLRKYPDGYRLELKVED